MTVSNMYGPSRVLIDSDYRRIGAHLIQPFDPDRVQPASYEVTLGPHLLRPVPYQPADLMLDVRERVQHQELRGSSVVDLRVAPPKMERIQIGGWYELEPGGVALVSTKEQVRCPSDMVCSVEGKSTLGRCFLAVHVTAGYVDPGYCGVITLELVNHAPWSLVLYEGMCIGQLRFTWLGVSCDRPYGSPGLGSHYQGSTDVMPPAGGKP